MAKAIYNTIPTEVYYQYKGYMHDDGSEHNYFKQISPRKSATKYNEQGQIYAAESLVRERYHGYSRTAAGRTSYDYYVGMGGLELVKKGSIDPCAAVLAIPATYGNFPNTMQGASSEELAWRPIAWHENKVWYYYFFAKFNFGKDKLKYTYPPENCVVSSPTNFYYRWSASCVFDQETTQQLVTTKPIVNRYNTRNHAYYNNERDIELGSRSGFDNVEFWYNTLSSANDGLNSRRTNAYDKAYGFIDDGKMAALNTYISHWKDMNNSSINNVFVRYIPIGFLPSLLTSQKLSSSIVSGFPIFTLENFDQMVKYFEGETWESDNDPIPEDFSTDWDIYIKGAQRPDIYITMKSEKLDKWLASDSNKAGAVKDDVKVEYRYPEFEFDIPHSPSEPPMPTNEFKLKNWEKDKYNVSRETSYESNILLNYPTILSAIGMNEFSDFAIEGLYPFYAQMQFRIKLDSEHYSAWCRYKIGVIGSPSVPDFTLMQNEGLQDDQNTIDESTVTLHYDEVPPGFDPFPIPPIPPLPPIPGTEPTPLPPGLNGLGLLTTTYKVTQSTTEALGRFFWGGDLFEKIKALNTSPIENVVGLTIMPININGSPSNIVIGNVDTNLNGDVITTTPLYTVGSLEWKGRYGSFLDFEPYTSAFIYLPFVGFIRIDPAYFTNKQLKVVYSYDIVCGLCNAMLYSNDIFVESHQGHCGINVPLIATNRADLQIGLASSLLETGASIATMGAVGTKDVVSAGVSTLGAAADYATGFHSSRQSGYSPTCIWHETRTCFVVIESTNANHSATYDRDKGRPAIASAYVASLRGYTELDAGVNLSGLAGASDTEIEELRQILATGFYA